MKKLIYLVIMISFLSFLSFPVQAQNIKGELNLTLSEELLSIYAKGEISDSIDNRLWKIGGDIDRQKSNSEEIRSEINLWSGFEVAKEKFFYSIDGKFIDDSVRDFRRTLFTANMGRQMNKSIKLKGGLGYSWAKGREDSCISTLDAEFKKDIFFDNLSLLFPLQEAKEFEAKNEIGIKKAISEKLSLKTSYLFRYFNSADDQYEHVLRTGITFEF